MAAGESQEIEPTAQDGAVIAEETRATKRRGGRLGTWLRRSALGIFALLALMVVGAVVFLNTQAGRDYIVERIAEVAPASGLSVEVGRIEGNVLTQATFFDVRLRDANDTLFLVLPEVRLDWRPLKFPFSGLDIRELDVNGGRLLAAPELNPGDPDAPILPDFNIRVDKLTIRDLRVVEGLLGEERIVGLQAQADIREGRLQLDADGQLGGQDRFAMFLDSRPDDNVFDVDLDYRAPAGGLLAALTGARGDLNISLKGDGSWQSWDGGLLVRSENERLVATSLKARAGRYRIVGQVRPGDYLTGLPQRALGEVVDIAVIGTLEDSVAEGEMALRGASIWADAAGAIDLADNRFDNLDVALDLRDPELFGDGMRLEDTELALVLDGPFRGLDLPHRLTVGRADLSGTQIAGITQQGIATWDGTRLVLPLDASVERIVSGNAMADPRLVNGTLGGTLVYTGGKLLSDDLAVRFPGLTANLALRGDIERGGYALAGPVEMRGLALENIGTVDGGAKIRFSIGNGVPWKLDANFTGRMARVTNATLANLAGNNIRFDGGVSLGADRPIVFRQTNVRASKLSLLLDGRVVNGTTTLAGRGRHVDYGPFTVQAALSGSGPRATLVFADPLPAAGLKDVRVAIAPTRNGFAIDTEGQSMLGRFDGALVLVSPRNGPTSVSITRMDVSGTSVTGDLVLGDGAVSGNLALAGGGIDGTVALMPRRGGQGLDAQLRARNARFEGPTPLAIARADIDVTGVIGGGGATLNGTVDAQGISYGQLFFGQVRGDAALSNGVGTFQAAMTGRRGGRFALQVQGSATSERIAVVADGSYAGRRITMPRRAVLLKQADGGWALQKTQLGFAGGFVIAEGRYGGTSPASGTVKLADMPLSLADVFGADLGLGGKVSGVVDFATGAGGLPTGEARVLVDDLTRSGLVLTSRPVDLAFVGRLSTNALQMRATFQDGGQTSGRMQGRIANLPGSGGLMQRLRAGDLFAQLRYKGPAEALWRLAALDLIDVTGPLNVAADVTGSLADPRIRGSLAGDNLKVQSALVGTTLNNVRARGRFAGSRLELSSFKGSAPNGGSVSGSGIVDLSNLGAGRGPVIDLRMAARNAEIMDLPNMGATVTGPMRIVSDGVGGTIAGRLQVDGARWKLGRAAQSERLPNVKVTEVNRPLDYGPTLSRSVAWRYLIDARSNGGIVVDGMGLDSEWSADILLRGTTDDPRIGGEARVVPRQGFYNFAGNRFDITRGVISFDENVPVDPRVQITAVTELRDGLDVTVTVRGNASDPEVDFSSNPGLPQEEILARLLFGGSITDLSATDALQLGSALASLRGGGGGGLDPINSLRTAIGLDRLRIIPADPALERGTAIALGKRFGNRFYGEIITDGRGYNATEVEFRITSWLALLATISSIGRDGVALEYSRDY